MCRRNIRHIWELRLNFLGECLPDFVYRVVRIHDFSNEELLMREDEISLLMMINKVQTPEDMERFLSTEHARIESILRRTPPHILEIITSTIWSLCMKMDMTVDRAEACVKNVRERKMGYLFENMKKWNVREEAAKLAKELVPEYAKDLAKDMAEDLAKDMMKEQEKVFWEKEQAERCAEQQRAMKALVATLSEKGMEPSQIAGTLTAVYVVSAEESEKLVQEYTETVRKKDAEF